MATITYTGHGAAGNWSDRQNWAGAAAPGAAYTVLVANDAASTENGTVSVGNIMVLGDAAVTFAGTVNSYGAGFCSGFMVCDDATVTFAPGSALNAAAGALQAGVDGVGTFLAQGTTALPTTIHTMNVTVGRYAIAVGTVTIDHATWANDGTAFIGYSGNGTVDVINGGQVTNGGNFGLGCNPGGVGAVNLASGGDLTVIGGAVLGGGGPTAGFGTGTVTVGTGSVFDVKNALRVNTGSAIDLQGGTVSAGDINSWLNVMAGGQLVGNGVVTTARALGFFEDEGHVEAQGGTLRIDGPVVGAGTMQIDANSTLLLTGHAMTLPHLAFAGANATLSLTLANSFRAEIDGFGIGDQIVLPGIDQASWNNRTQLLTLSSGGKTVDALHVAGNYATDIFQVSQNAGVGVITLHSM